MLDKSSTIFTIYLCLAKGKVSAIFLYFGTQSLGIIDLAKNFSLLNFKSYHFCTNLSLVGADFIRFL